MKKILILITLIILGSLIYFGYNEFFKEEINYTSDSCFTFENNTIIDYNMVCGSKVIIPPKINNEQVLYIGNYAFKDKELKEVSLPNELEVIGIGSFQNNLLRSIYIPDTVYEIKALAFENNIIRELNIKNVKEIGIKAFSNNDLKTKYAFIYKRVDGEIDKTTIIGYGGRSKDIKIPEGVLELSSYALAGNNIKTITFNDELQRIESYALSDNLLNEVIIPKNVLYVGDGNFDNQNITILGKLTLEDFNCFDNEFTNYSLVEFKNDELKN